MTVREKIPQVAGIRQSVEVQHGARGLVLMLRRGLHGAKNWALEREADGSHRSVWTKLFRVAVVLTPLWIVLSAVTGGPQRGGHSASIAQSLFMAVLVLLVELGLFSARERKLGREEPWAELKPVILKETESDESEDDDSDGPDSEAPTEVFENAQVEEPDPGPEPSFHGDENGESGENAQTISTVVPQAIETEPETLVIPASDPVPEPVHEAPEKATSESAVDHGVPQVRNTPWNPSSGVPTVVLDKAVTDDLFQQVTADIEADWPDVPQAISEDLAEPVTEGERNDLPDTPTVPFRTASRPVFHGTEEPQVEAPEEPIRETFQAEFQCLFADQGPYPAGEDPVADDWWLVKPDVEEEQPEEPVLEHEQDDHDPWAAPDETAPEEPVEAPVTASVLYPEVVQRYFAAKVQEADEAEMSAARNEVMLWAVAEVNAGRSSQSEMAKLLGVAKATMSRWMNTEVRDGAE